MLVSSLLRGWPTVSFDMVQATISISRFNELLRHDLFVSAPLLELSLYRVLQVFDFNHRSLETRDFVCPSLSSI